jgi:hypothetical protein
MKRDGGILLTADMHCDSGVYELRKKMTADVRRLLSPDRQEQVASGR